MRNLFFDTSALVKRYDDERGTDTVDTLVDDEVDDFAFVCADQELNAVARSRTLETLNPDADDPTS